MIVEILEFDAQSAARHRMLFISANFDQPPVDDFINHRARIGTIVRACAKKLISFNLLVHRSLPRGRHPFMDELLILFCRSLASHLGNTKQNYERIRRYGVLQLKFFPISAMP
jgi:hypothetical protein